MVEMKETLRGASLVPLISKKPMVLDSSETLADVFSLMSEKNELAFLVKLQDGFGFVSIDLLEGIPKAKWQSTPAGAVAQGLPSVSANASAADLMAKVVAKGYPLFPVVQNGKLFGVVYARELQKLCELERLKGRR